MVAGLVGHLVSAKSVYGDSLAQARRSRPMTPAAELIWQMLPPLTFATEQIVLAAVLEPCYEVGGDAFDYAVDGPLARFGVFDAVGRACLPPLRRPWRSAPVGPAAARAEISRPRRWPPIRQSAHSSPTRRLSPPC